MKAPRWQNSEIERLRPTDGYSSTGMDSIESELRRHGTFSMRSLASGLFPAATANSTGYNRVWVRDNVYVAYASYVCGNFDVAASVAHSIFRFFCKYKKRFEAIVHREADADCIMNRPHVRFDGETLGELHDEKWAHAQNDALGYALWLYSTLASARVVPLDSVAVDMLELLPRYFKAVRYWNDEDNGHWEETRRRSASSIGTVVAGLETLGRLALSRGRELRASGFTPRMIDVILSLAAQGRAALDSILPSECVQISPQQNRRYDAALVFLINPLNVVNELQAELILADVETYLTGSYGIRRYLGDSYWAPDYDERLPPDERCRDYSEDVSVRDEL